MFSYYLVLKSGTRKEKVQRVLLGNLDYEGYRVSLLLRRAVLFQAQPGHGF